MDFGKFVLAEAPTFMGEPYFAAGFTHDAGLWQRVIDIDSSLAFNFPRMKRHDPSYGVKPTPAGVAVQAWTYDPQPFFAPGNKIQSPLTIGIHDPDTGDCPQLQMRWHASGGPCRV